MKDLRLKIRQKYFPLPIKSFSCSDPFKNVYLKMFNKKRFEKLSFKRRPTSLTIKRKKRTKNNKTGTFKGITS